MGYDSKNRLTSYKGTAITYDADGNMSVGVPGTAAASFQYDSANRLTSATGTTYQYDNEGNRIQSQTSEQTLTYVYDTTGSMSRMLMSKTQDGAITKYIYGNGLIAQENASGYYSYHYDLRGSTIALTNASGTVTNTYVYDTYGTVTKKTGTLTVLFLYNGRDGVVTDSNGLLYMRARYYSPQLKRFINADVVVGSIQESPTLNRYAYVNGNPISYVDPFGLSAEPGSNWVDTGHMVLDILGLLPVVGEIFDGTNVIWYLLAGDLVNAGFSATAFLPIIGDAAGAGKLIQNATSKVGSQAAELFAKYGDDVAKWADDILGFAKKEGLEVALPDGGSLKLWGDSAENAVKFAATGSSNDLKNGYKTINPNEIRYSQSSVNGSSEIIQSMKKNGWKGDRIDVVKMPDGIYTTIDNTRVVSARKVGIDVQANVHGYNDLLPIEGIQRFKTKYGTPKTWGEAIELRVRKQKASFRNGNPYGAFNMETIK